MSSLKIDDIVKVVVSAPTSATPRAGFNIGLIVGKSEHIATADRCKVYSGLDGMVNDGFEKTDAEYKAATLYFAQDPAPAKVVVGVCGSGETWVKAITECRNKNATWYGVCCAGEVELSEHQAIAAYIETIRATYFYSDNADGAKDSSKKDVFSTLMAQSFKRSFGLFSSTAHAAAAAMGFAMGANTGTAGSAYTMAYKTLAGVAPDALSETDVENLKSKNANYYITRGGTYNILEPGVTANGDWYDEVIGIDQLANDIQIACMDTLANTKTKIPYTDAGALQFVLACNGACQDAVDRGFLAPGIWNGVSILDLENGDTLEAGYLCQAEPVADQSAADKALRICPPIYACVNLAGAVHSVTIKVDMQ